MIKAISGRYITQIHLVMCPVMQWIITRSLGHKPTRNESFFWYVDHRLATLFALVYCVWSLITHPHN